MIIYEYDALLPKCFISVFKINPSSRNQDATHKFLISNAYSGCYWPAILAKSEDAGVHRSVS